MRRLCLALLILCFPGAAASAEPAVPVFLFAGQSNMAGYGARSGDLPPSEWDRHVLFAWRDAHAEHAFTFAQGTKLQPDRYGGWGPEVGFARALLGSREIQPPIAIIKVTNGGTSLWQDWNAHYPEQKAEIDPKFLPSHGQDVYVPMWDPLIRHTRLSLQSLRDQGYEPRLAGFFWCQGESDKKSRHEYLVRFRRFILELRRELETPELPIIIAETGPEEVRTAHRLVAEEFGGVSLQTDLPGYSKPDEVHWNGPTLLDLGRRMAHAWLDLSANTP